MMMTMNLWVQAIESARIMDNDSAKEFSNIVARYVDQKMNKNAVDW